MILMLYTATYMPYRLAFVAEDSDAIIYFENFTNVFFVVDIFINFISVYEDPITQQTVYDNKKIALKYLRGWLTFDCISCVPTDFFF